MNCLILVAGLANVSIAIGYSVEEVSRGNETYLCAYHQGEVPSAVFTMNCSKRMYGRYIRLTAVDFNGALRLQEVETYGW